MSRALHIQGVLYLSASEAGKRFGYTSDYISRLARSEKISGQRVGHQWFVDPDSLRKFKYRGDEERTLRAEKLRAQRKQERALAAVVVEAQLEEKVTEPIKVRHVVENPRNRLTALVQAGSVLGMGTVVGAFMFLTMQSESLPNLKISYNGIASGIAQQTEQFAFALYNLDVEMPHRMLAQVVAVGDRESETSRGTSASNQGIVVFEEGTTDEEAVAEHFSDEVRVTLDHSGEGGVIQPVFKSGKEERYRFLMVPINSINHASP